MTSQAFCSKVPVHINEGHKAKNLYYEQIKKLEKWDIHVPRLLLGLDSGTFSLPLSSEALKEVTQHRQDFKSSHKFNRITVRLLVVSEVSDLKGEQTFQLKHTEMGSAL